MLLSIIKGLLYDYKKDIKNALHWYINSKTNISYINKRIGFLFLMDKQWKMAELYLKKVKYKDAVSWYKYGLSMERQGKYYKAAMAYEKAISKRKDWLPWREHYNNCILNVDEDKKNACILIICIEKNQKKH